MTPAQPQLRQTRPPALPGHRDQRICAPTETAIPPETVWATLSPALHAQLRQTLLRITGGGAA